MKNQELFNLFIDEVADMYSCEQQIIHTLPKLIRMASLDDLKEALRKHLEETKEQVNRIKKIFSLIKIPVSDKTCLGMEGILKEGEEAIENQAPSPTLDACIICSCQKVEHYEIACYGTLKSFAKHLDLDSEVVDLLDRSLDEEAAADKKLTKLAEGSLFRTGINKDAAEHATFGSKRRSA